jgi:hypothetical protein
MIGLFELDLAVMLVVAIARIAQFVRSLNVDPNFDHHAVRPSFARVPSALRLRQPESDKIPSQFSSGYYVGHHISYFLSAGLPTHL